MKYANIIWDWNGTLLNDVQLCVDIANEILENHNDTRLDINSYRSVFGFPITGYYEKLGIDFEKESFEDLTKKFINRYNVEVKHNNLHTNVKEMLSYYKSEGIQQFILTAAYKKDALHLLAYYGILPIFEMVEGLDNYRAESKLDRGHHLLKTIEINKSQTVLIGDTIHDMKVAEALAIDCILVANGHQSKERLLANANSSSTVIDELGMLNDLIS